tara:strand:+ start:238 stop:402 length:165 start_codon:yes stop_codon:yes gene_type:complete
MVRFAAASVLLMLTIGPASGHPSAVPHDHDATDAIQMVELEGRIEVTRDTSDGN